MALLPLCVFVLGCVLSASAAPAEVTAADPVVTLPQGDVRGTVKTTPSGKEFNAFMGIPFGNAERFALPTAAGAWTGVFDGTQEPPFCPQPIFETPIVGQGTEDCLTLSVFVPAVTAAGPLKVHVFIHGGAFFMGNIHSDKYGPERYFEQTDDVIIVLIQYRLGPFGFLSTQDSSAPGNFGLWDQNLGLNWVKNNIANFNGDPNAVSLHGESAGSVSVSSHILSQKSAGLFQQAVLESGTATNYWGYIENPLTYAQDLANRFSCDISTTQALIACLKQVPADQLAVTGFDVMSANLIFAFVPTVDGDFITDDPAKLYEEGNFNRVPMIQGFNRDEGCLVYMFVPFLFQDINDAYFNDVLPVLVRTLTDYRTNLVNISYAIKAEYYDIDLTDAELVTRNTIDMISDMIIKSGTVQTIQFASQYVDVYMYTFNYVGNYSKSYYTGAADVTHAIELMYLYNNTVDAPPLDAPDSAFSETFVNLWMNFDTVGNPTPVGSATNWPKTPKGQTTYFTIDKEFSVSNGYDPDRMDFWLVTVPQIAAA